MLTSIHVSQLVEKDSKYTRLLQMSGEAMQCTIQQAGDDVHCPI